MVAVAIIGVCVSALYGGMTFAMGNLQRARETQRATQILTEKLDTIRLYGWDKITSGTYIPPTFITSFAPADPGLSALGQTNRGFYYYGTIEIGTPDAVSDVYKHNMRQVTVILRWTNSSPRTSSMTTFVAKNGLHTYVY